MKKNFYFDKYEDRLPPLPVPYSATREMFWQFLATINLVLGGWYIYWRWRYSINYDALWFSIPLIIAETASFFGSLLFTFNLWKIEDTPITSPPYLLSECCDEADMKGREDRPISVDVYFPTYSEDPELVRKGIQDSKKMNYPHNIEVKIYVLDDGKREEMRKVAEEEQVGYFTRSSNIGFKAGNLRNAMEQTSGDFIVINDADSRPLPTMLERMMGYFRDPKVAWVQSTHWFFEIYEGETLRNKLKRKIGKVGYYIGKGLEKVVGDIKIDKDPFSEDPSIFFDVIMRRRNWANASFCCGAGSIHRRDAVMQAAIIEHNTLIEREADKKVKSIKDKVEREKMREEVTRDLMMNTELTPYKFHVSEDIYTSIVLHADKNKWKSIYHPYAESKMLSPQDLVSWTIQRFKYAGGTLDIFFHDNPVFRGTMNWKQKIMYMATFWSYFGGIWNLIFLLAPIVFFFTGKAPVSTYSAEFFMHFVPFFLMNEIAFMIGQWGICTWVGKSAFVSFFSINLHALWTVLRGKEIKFKVTPKHVQQGNHINLVIPQLTIIILTIVGGIFYVSRGLFGLDVNLSAVIANYFWAACNILTLSGFVFSAFFKTKEEPEISN